MGFFSRFFIVNRLVDYLNLTLNIQVHFGNMNPALKTYLIFFYIDKKREKKCKIKNPIKSQKKWDFSENPGFFQPCKKCIIINSFHPDGSSWEGVGTIRFLDVKLTYLVNDLIYKLSRRTRWRNGRLPVLNSGCRYKDCTVESFIRNH